MELHRPKAAHSFREFLIEIGTIICGILIALGLEQAVETAHRDAEVREAREALTYEMRENVGRLHEVIRENSCLEAQLDGYAAWAKGGPKPPSFRFFGPLLKTSAWDSVRTAVVPHMPLTERISRANFYDQLGNAVRNREAQTALHVALLKYNDLSTLSPAQRDGLLETVSQERRYAHNLSGNARFMISAAAAAGVKEGAEGAAAPQIARVRSAMDWVCGRSATDPFNSRP